VGSRGYAFADRVVPFVVVGFLGAALLAIAPQPVRAQCQGICKSNEVLVDEDEDHCYCRDRHSYAQCVAEKGRKLKAERQGKCARVMQGCMRDNDLILTFDAIACVAACQTFAGCAPACGVAGAHAWTVAQQCHISATPCFEDALRTHKQGIQDCKRN
jgi:hypothetical protein